jgi:hypothetical protein
MAKLGFHLLNDLTRYAAVRLPVVTMPPPF